MIVLIILAIVLGLCGGMWLSHETKAELQQGRRWFAAILIISLLAAIVCAVFFRDIAGYESLLASCLFLATLAAVSYKKSS